MSPTAFVVNHTSVSVTDVWFTTNFINDQSHDIFIYLFLWYPFFLRRSFVQLFFYLLSFSHPYFCCGKALCKHYAIYQEHCSYKYMLEWRTAKQTSNPKILYNSVAGSWERLHPAVKRSSHFTFFNPLNLSFTCNWRPPTHLLFPLQTNLQLLHGCKCQTWMVTVWWSAHFSFYLRFHLRIWESQAEQINYRPKKSLCGRKYFVNIYYPVNSPVLWHWVSSP